MDDDEGTTRQRRPPSSVDSLGTNVARIATLLIFKMSLTNIYSCQLHVKRQILAIIFFIVLKHVFDMSNPSLNCPYNFEEDENEYVR